MNLGAEVVDSTSFDARCTHLVVGQPGRNEKFLAAIAAGLWILHPSYVSDSAAQSERCFYFVFVSDFNVRFVLVLSLSVSFWLSLGIFDVFVLLAPLTHLTALSISVAAAAVRLFFDLTRPAPFT